MIGYILILMFAIRLNYTLSRKDLIRNLRVNASLWPRGLAPGGPRAGVLRYPAWRAFLGAAKLQRSAGPRSCVLMAGPLHSC